MSTKYTYSITNDFPNQAVATDKLQQEIGDSTIIVALDYIAETPTDCDVWFKADLSAGEVTTLSGIVSAHDGQPIVVEDFTKTTDGRLLVHSTPRKEGLKFVWFGEGDDPSSPTNVGGGECLHFHHTISGSLSESIYIDFNSVENETYIHQGHLYWSGCKLDTLDAYVVPRVTSTAAGSGTYYNTYGGYLIIPAAGDGTTVITSDITTHSGGLIYMPLNEQGIRSAAYWNADWNTTTKLYENITAAPAGNGSFNMFSIEVPLQCFVKDFDLVGESSLQMQSSDSDKLGHGMRLKLVSKTNTTDFDDHEWMLSCLMVLHRAKTV